MFIKGHSSIVSLDVEILQVNILFPFLLKCNLANYKEFLSRKSGKKHKYNGYALVTL
jgi:hypothetical protein